MYRAALSILTFIAQGDGADLRDKGMIRRCYPEPGDILVSCSGTIGRVCEVPADFRGVLVRSAALVKLERTRGQSRFIEAGFQSDTVQTQILNFLRKC